MAASFQIQRSQVTPSGQVGAVPLSTNVDTGSQAISQAFGQLGNQLFQIGEQQADAKNALEVSRMRREYDELTAATQEELKNVSDEQQAAQIIDKYKSAVSGMKSGVPVVNDSFAGYRDSTITGYTSAFAKTIEHNRIKELNDRFDVEYQSALRTGDQDNAFKLLDNLQAAGAITQAKAQAVKDSFFGDHVLAKANMLINTGDPADLDEADKLVSTMGQTASKDKTLFTAKQLDSLDSTRSALIQANNRMAAYNKQAAQAAEKDLIDKMSGMTMTLDDVKQYRNVLDADTYLQYSKIAMSPTKPGNNVQEAAFRTMVSDVWSGARNEEDVRALLRQSLAESDGISTQQYVEISSKLDSEVNKVHSQVRREMQQKAARLILDKHSKAITIDVNGNMNFDVSKIGSGQQKDFERKMHYVDLYTRAIDDLIASNPSISRKELYTQSSSLRDQYINASKSGAEVQQAAPRPVNPDPIHAPDAEWSNRFNAWTVVRDGKTYIVEAPQ